MDRADRKAFLKFAGLEKLRFHNSAATERENFSLLNS
jgi:hypothetical protein